MTSGTTSEGRQPVPDDLRTRIAKTLHRLYGPSLGAHPDGWDREPGGTREMYLEDADAVIRELGAFKEDGECSYCHAQLPGCRYVTDWEPSVD